MYLEKHMVVIQVSYQWIYRQIATKGFDVNTTSANKTKVCVGEEQITETPFDDLSKLI